MLHYEQDLINKENMEYLLLLGLWMHMTIFEIPSGTTGQTE